MLEVLKRFEDALAAYDEAIRLAPTDAYAWGRKGIVLRHLSRLEEAKQAANTAIQLRKSLQ